MAEITHTYAIGADMPGGAVNVGKLIMELEASDVVANIVDVNGRLDVLKIVLDDDIAGDKTIIDGDATGPAGGLLAAHDNTPNDNPQPVMAEPGTEGGIIWNLAEYTTDPVTPELGDMWVRNTAGTRRLVSFDGTNKHAVILTQE